MKRTLIAGRTYFGIEALLLQRGAERVVARVGQSSTPVVTTIDSLQHDFQVGHDAAMKLAEALVHGGLLTALPQFEGYGITERLREYAEAQMLAPLDHDAAKALLDRVLAMVAEINARWRANPIMVARVAVSGRYTDAASKVPELNVWAIVRLRPSTSRRIWTRQISKVDGAHEIRKALRTFGPMVNVRMVVDEASVERPFVCVFDADAGDGDHHDARARFGDWSQRIGQLISTRRTREAELDRLCGSRVARTTI